MTDACVAMSSASTARGLLAGTDCFVANRVASAYEALLAPGGAAATTLTIALSIYAAIYGYRLILGHSTLSVRDLVPRLFGIGLVLALIGNWPAYQLLVYNLLLQGPEHLAGLVLAKSPGGDASSGGDVLAAMQALFDQMTEYAGVAWTQSSVTSPLPPVSSPIGLGVSPIIVSGGAAHSDTLGAPQFVAAALWISALTIMVGTVGLLLVSRLLLAILLVFGPLFIALAIFPASRSLTEGWMRVAVKFALVPMFVLPLAAVVVTVLTPFVAQLSDTSAIAIKGNPAPIILLVSVVFATVLVSALGLTGTIAGGIRLPRQARVSPAADQLLVPLASPLTSRAEVIAERLPGRIARDSEALRDNSNLLVTRLTDGMGRRQMGDDVAGRLGQSEQPAARRNAFAALQRVKVG